MRGWQFAVLSLVVFPFLTFQWVSLLPHVAELEPEEVGMLTVVLEDQIAQSKTDPSEFGIYYIAIKENDPPDELMSRLRKHDVRRNSTDDQPNSCFGSGWHFNVSTWNQLDDSTFEVHAGQGRMQDTYRVIYRGGAWAIDHVDRSPPVSVD